MDLGARRPFYSSSIYGGAISFAVLTCCKSYTKALLSLYRCRKKNVNQARYYLFQHKYRRIEKIIDFSILSPYKSVLVLHAKKANYVAKICKSLGERQIQTPDIDMYRWQLNYEIKWLEKEFPGYIPDLLIDPTFDELET